MIEWNVLNIEETKDEEAITNAYRKMLTITNPEDNPGGFMLLRNTYEQAIAYARGMTPPSPMMNSGMQNMGMQYNNGMAPQPYMNTNEAVITEAKDEDLDKTMVIDNISDIIKRNMNRGSVIPFANASNSGVKQEPANDTPAMTGGFGSAMDSRVSFGNSTPQQNDMDEDSISASISSERSFGGSSPISGSSQNNESIYAAGQVFTSRGYPSAPDEENEEEVAITEWIQQVENTYYNFSSRISQDIWLSLLANPVCDSLEYRSGAMDSLLKFLMKHYYLPQNIWNLIDSTFDLQGQRMELLERYPKEFIDDVVMSSINYPDIINYYLFEMNLQIDYDQFISKFFAIVRYIRQNQLEEAYMALCDIDTYGSVHPYVEVERVKYFINMGHLAEAMNISTMLYEKYPEDESIVYIRAEIAWAIGNIGEASIYYQKLISINEDHYYAKLGLADCYMHEKEFEKAKDLYTQLREVNPYDSYVIENIDAANACLINYFEEKIKNNKSDNRSMLKLAWCYLQNDNTDQAIKLGKTLEVTADPFDYCNILGKAYLQKKDYQNAIMYLEKWISTIRNIPRNGNRENRVKYQRLGQALELLGQAHELSGAEKKALNLYKMAKKEEPRSIAHRLTLARYLSDLGKYDDCIYECEEVLKMDERNFEANYYRAVALYQSDYLSKALEAFDECIKLYQFDVNSYVYKIRILMKYCEYDQIESIFEFLDNNCIGSAVITFYKTKMNYDKEVIEQTKNKSEDMIDYEYFIGIYEGLLENYKNGTSEIDDPDPIYVEIAKLYVCIGEYKRSLGVLKNIHSKDKTNIEVYECMAISLEKLHKYKGALESYKRILLLCPDHREANIKIAELLEKQEDYEEAIKFHSKQLAITKSITGYINRGNIYLKMDDFESAKKDFKEAIKMNPYNPMSYNQLGVAYMYECNFEEAKKNFLQAIDRIEQERTPDPYRNLALIYTKTGQFEKAIECYKTNIDLFSDAYDYEKIAEIYYEQKEYKKSVEAYNKRCKLIENADEMTNTELYVWVGKCNTGLESEKTAFKYYTKAIETAKMVGNKCYDAYIQIAKMYMQIDKFVLAKKFYKEASASDRMTIEDKIEYAYCCFVAGDFAEGQKYVNTALQAIDKMSETNNNEKIKKHYLKGYTYLIQNKIDLAQECINEAFKCRTCNNCKYPKCHRAIALQGLILEKKGNIAGAMKCLGDALALVPGNSKYIHDFNRVKE